MAPHRSAESIGLRRKRAWRGRDPQGERRHVYYPPPTRRRTAAPTIKARVAVIHPSVLKITTWTCT